MSEVTVQAIQPVLGLDDGAVVTIERTARVDAAISQGRLRVLPDPIPGVDKDAVAADAREAAEAHADAEAATARDALGNEEQTAAAAASPRAKRVRKLAGD